MDFGNVLTRAWRITWRYRVLWLFGILAGCSNGRGGSGGSNFNYSQPGNEAGAFPLHLQQQFMRMLAWMDAHRALLFSLGLLLLLWVLTMAVLGLISRASLIAGFDQADADPEAELQLGELWQAGLQVFWRFLGLGLLSLALMLAVLAIFFGPALFLIAMSAMPANFDSATTGGLVMLGVSLVCVGALAVLVLAIVWSGVRVFADRAVVLRDADIWTAVRTGWNLFRKNLGTVLVMGLIVFALRMGFALVVMLPWAPAIVAMMRWALRGGAFPLQLVLLNLVIAVPLTIFVNGLFYAFTSGVWTLTYRDLTGKAELTPQVVAAEGELPLA